MTDNRPTRVRNRYILLADLGVILVAALGSYSLRFDWLFPLYRDEFPLFVLVVVAVKPLVFYLTGMYRRYWRFASIWDLVAVVLATAASSVVVAVVMAALRVFDYVPGFPRGVVPIDWLLTMTLAGGVRMSVRVLAEMQTHAGASQRRKRVLVIGAGQAGVMVLREIQRNPQLGMELVGFLDDDPAKRGKTVLGTRVLGDLHSLPRLLSSTKVDEVVIAIPTAPGSVIRSVVEQCRKADVASRVIPGVFELLDGKASVSRLRNVEISDLLRRAQVTLASGARGYIEGRCVLVTGAGGSIGTELCRQIARDEPRVLILLGHGENSVFDVQMQLRDAFPDVRTDAVIADVRDRTRLGHLFARYKPEVVFHAAAHKHVPLMEDNPEEAITNNVIGTRNIVDAAIASGTSRLVMISTDKAVSPTNYMGASKRVAETIVRRQAARHGRSFAVVRFGNVLGSRGSVVPIFKAQIESGGPLTVTHPEMRRFFMTIPEAVHLVLEAGGHAAGGELFVLNMGEPVRIVDLAEDLVELSGFKRGDVPIRFTGLRPGEKLNEELWEEGATISPTPTRDVLRVRERADAELRDVDLDRFIEDLERAARAGDRLEIQHCLAQLIPNFAPPVTPSV